MGHHESDDALVTSSNVSRRRLLQVFGAAALASPLLAACGGSDGKTPTAADLGDVGAKLKTILGDSGKLGTVGSIEISGIWPLTGQGSVYGDYQTKGWLLGTKHIKEWSGLDIKTNILDHKSGDPAAGTAAARKAGEAGSPFFPSSYIFDFGAIAPACAQYKMLSLDGGGGTGPAAKGIPYLYGFRAGWPQDPQPGMTKYLRETFPDKKKWAVISWDAGDAYVTPLKQAMQETYAKYDVDLVAFEVARIGDTNYDAVVQKVKAANPDVVVLLTGGTDCGYQAKAIQRAGLNATVLCSEYTPDAIQIAGPAYKDWYFGYDFLNVNNPTNDWTSLFIDAFRTEYGKDPINYSAAYYCQAFAYAELMKRTLDKGGDVKDGAQYIPALEENPTFKHVYGGSGSTLGELTIDLTTHSPSAIPMIGFQSNGAGDVKELVTYNVNANDYKVL